MNNYFDYDNGFSKGYSVLDKRYIGVWSFIGLPSPSPTPVPSPVPLPNPPHCTGGGSGSLPTGTISLNDVQNVFGGTNPIGINEYYGVASGIPASGTISLQDFQGASAGGGHPQGVSVTTGYIVGGTDFTAPYPTGFKRDTKLFSFSNETYSSTPPSSLYPIPIRYVGGISDDSNGEGFFGGGLSNPPNGVYQSTLYRITYSNNTWSNPPGGMIIGNSNKIAYTATAFNDDYGWWAGGFTPNNTVKTIQRINFSNETSSLPGNNLVLSKYQHKCSNSADNAYFANGTGGFSYPSGYQNTIERLYFANETVANSPATFPSPKASTANVYNKDYGYFIGGFSGGPAPPYNNLVYHGTVTRFDLCNETISSPGNNNPANVGGFGNSISSEDYGYYTEFGAPPFAATSIKTKRLDFSSETISNAANNQPSYPSGASAQSSGVLSK